MARAALLALARPIDCARLSLRGGSLLAGFRPGLVTTRLPRAVRSRRSQISTATGTSPVQTTCSFHNVLITSSIRVWGPAFSVHYAGELQRPDGGRTGRAYTRTGS